MAWIILYATIPIIASADKIDDDYIIKHLKTAMYSLDTNAAAVVLYEKGSTLVSEGTNKYYTRHRLYRIIKIIKSSALDEADVVHGYYDTKDFSGSISNVRGATYTLDGDKLVKTTLAKEAISDKRIDEYHSELRFTLPAARVGSIIEYSYELESPLGLDVPSWSFQGEYPTLKSQYEMDAPNNFKYTYLIQGMPASRSYSSYKKAEASKDSCYVSTESSLSGGTSNVWSRSNVPALKSEPFVSNLMNHVERLDLQLSGFTSGQYWDRNVYNSWERANEELWNSEKFGMLIRKSNNYVDNIVDSLVREIKDPMGKARKIFSYVRGNFYCNDTIAFRPKKSLSKVFESKTGNAAEINFILTIMLHNAGITAAPVILGTMGNLKVSELYPIMDRFNHTVTSIVIDGKWYLLDASNKYNPFGTLPLYCYNGYARAIDKVGQGMYITSFDIKERNVMVVSVSDLTDTGYTMRISESYGKFQSRSIRQQWSADVKARETYINERVRAFADNGYLLEGKVENFDNPDTSIVVKYIVHQKFEKPISTFYLATDIIKQFPTTPFKAMERRLPVELPYQIEFIYALNMKLPENVDPEDIPKGGVIIYDNDKMNFRHLIGYDTDMRYLNVSSKFTTTYTTFLPAEYEVIRKFFGEMIVEQNKVMTLKIKKQ